MPSTDEKKTNRWSLPLWCVVWLLLFLSSLLPIAIHHWKDMSASFDRLRYGWGLLPAELLFLSWLNDISYFIPVVVIALFVWGLERADLEANTPFNWSFNHDSIFSDLQCFCPSRVIDVSCLVCGFYSSRTPKKG